jgi:transcriptional regulator with XRE-family HTH domain
MTNGIDATYLHGSPRTLAGLVRESREAALLTQEELAERSGLSVRTIRDIESGRILRPRSASVRALADALDLTAQQRKALIATRSSNLLQTIRSGGR